LNSNINWLYLHNKLIKFNEGKENIIKLILLLLYSNNIMYMEKTIPRIKNILMVWLNINSLKECVLRIISKNIYDDKFNIFAINNNNFIYIITI
jgi:hypothetical protein